MSPNETPLLQKFIISFLTYKEKPQHFALPEHSDYAGGEGFLSVRRNANCASSQRISHQLHPDLLGH
jgi:hypothetical protein